MMWFLLICCLANTALCSINIYEGEYYWVPVNATGFLFGFATLMMEAHDRR